MFFTDAPAENPLNPRVRYEYLGGKSTGTALAWSGLGTLAPIALGLSLATVSDDANVPFILVSSGLAVGPSLGEFYAASVKRYNVVLKARGEWGWSPFLIPGTDGSMRIGALAYLRF